MVYRVRWIIGSLLAIAALFFAYDHATSPDRVVQMWEAFNSGTSYVWLLLWFPMLLVAAAIIVPVETVPARAILFLVSIMLVCGYHQFSSQMVGFTRAAVFAEAAARSNPEHFFLDTIEENIRAGNVEWLAEKRGYRWGTPVKPETMIRLRAWATMLNSESASVARIKEWIASGFVPSGIYPDLLDSIAKDPQAFENIEVDPSEIAMIIGDI